MTEAEMMEAIANFRTETADFAEVEDRRLTDGLRAIRFRPTNSNAVWVTLIVSARDVVMQVGGGGRFELDLDEEPVDILRAAAAGRVEEKTTVLGTTCRVFLADGSERKSTRLFNWTIRGGLTRQYVAWRPSED
jgi:hypothetical protein